MEAGMSAPVALRDAPSRFLDPGKWAELRSFASNDLIALTYMNAQYPDKNELFCHKRTSRTATEASEGLIRP
jgi:hypothetical protein